MAARWAVDGRNIRAPILINFALAIFFVTGVFLTTAYLDEKGEQEAALVQAARTVDRLFRNHLEEESDAMGAALYAIVRDDKLKAAFLARDRQRLLRATRPLYEKLKQSLGATHLYFITPGRRAFLRVHKPDRYGDRIDRSSVREAERTGKSLSGLELGPLGTLALRRVVPWRDRGRLIGYVELGIEAGSLIEEIKEALSVDVLIVVRRDFLDPRQWAVVTAAQGANEDRRAPSSHVVLAKTMATIPGELADLLDRPGPLQRPRFSRVMSGGRTLHAGIMPLAEAGGRVIGEMAVIRDITAAVAWFDKEIAIAVAVSALGLAAILALFGRFLGRVERRVASFHDELERKVAERTKDLDGLNALLRGDITELTKAGAALIREKEKAENYLAISATMIVALDRDGVVTLINKKGCEVLGYDEAEIVGKNWFETFAPESGTCCSFAGLDKPAGESPFLGERCEGEIVTKGGQRRLISWRNSFILDDDGEIVGTLSSGEDATERRQAEAALQKKAGMVRLLQQVAMSANEAQVPEEAFRAALDAVCAYTGWPLGHAFIFDATSPDTLVSGNIWHLDDEDRFATFRKVSENARLKKGVGLVGRVLESGKPEWIREMAKDPTCQRIKKIEDLPVSSGFAFPVLAGSEQVAVLEFFTSETVEPDESLLETLVHVGTQLGRVTERKRAVEALREREKRLDGIVTNIDEGLITIRDDGIIESVNPAALRIFGYSSDELIGRNVRLLMPEPDRSRHDGHIRRYVSTGEGRILGHAGREVEGRRKDGAAIPLELTISEMAVGGERLFIGVLRDITERKQAEEALKESEARLANAQRMAHLGNWDWNIETGELDWSDEIYRIFGLEPREFGATYEAFLDSVHPDDRDYVKNSVDKALYESTPYSIDHRIVLPTAEVRYVHEQAEVMFDPSGEPVRMSGTVQDITERKTAERALRESEERFRQIAETSPIPVFIARIENGFILYCNAAAGALVGLRGDRLVGRSIHEFYDNADDRDEFLRALTGAGRIDSRETRIRRADGSVTWGLLSAHTVEFAGAHVGLIQIVDITRSKEAQAQLLQASKLATLGELASGIAHELNQPLSIIGMDAELALMIMEDGEPDAGVIRSKLETIVGQKDRMAEIINHMRQFSRSHSSARVPVDPRGCVDGAVHLVQRQFEALGIDVEKHLAKHCRSVLASPVQLEQVILNLLTNAHDAVSQRRAEAEGDAYKAKISVSVSDGGKDNNVVIAVEDNGCGIPADAVARMFDPFFTTKDQAAGTGLGLSISQNIIAAMGGRIAATNTGRGARLEIVLPAAGDTPVAKLRPCRPKAQAGADGEASPCRLSVLVVDDEELAVQSIAEHLRREGYALATAGNGKEALDAYGRSVPDVVITDLRMPVMDGNELIRELRKRDSDMPIIVTTGHTLVGDDSGVVAEGASVVFRKPVSLKQLSDVLRHLTESEATA